jgi:hypothetical protein
MMVQLGMDPIMLGEGEHRAILSIGFAPGNLISIKG